MEEATIKDYARMCRANECEDCIFRTSGKRENEGCADFIISNPDKANEIILKWIKEHPIKTRQSELLKAFPNVPINSEIISICPLDFDKRFESEVGCHSYKDCTTCKKEYWLAEVDE